MFKATNKQKNNLQNQCAVDKELLFLKELVFHQLLCCSLELKSRAVPENGRHVLGTARARQDYFYQSNISSDIFGKAGAAVSWNQVKPMETSSQSHFGTLEISFMLPFLVQTDGVNCCFFSYYVRKKLNYLQNETCMYAEC